MKIAVLPIAALTGALIASGATAQQRLVNAQAFTSDEIAPMLNARSKKFRFVDLNDDGYISRDEIGDDDQLRSQFGSLNTNNDGKLSEDEYVLSHRKAIRKKL